MHPWGGRSRNKGVNSLSLCTRLMGLLEIRSSEWGRGTTHCARARANTHSLVHIMRNCYKSTSCFQNCWFFITLSYSYQAMKAATSQIWSHSFPSVLLHTQAKNKKLICGSNYSFIITEKCHVWIVELRQRQSNTQGCFCSQRLRASGFSPGMSHSSGLNLAVRRDGWRSDCLGFFWTNDTSPDNQNTRWCHKSKHSQRPFDEHWFWEFHS